MKHVRFHLPSFLRRVRIHGGEFDSSARAMNRVNGKGSLMSYERAVLVQADPRIVRGSTIERKQMSTTIKRVALVAVAALGLGVLSVVPSQATSQSDSLTLSAATATQQTSETATASSAVATLTYLADSLDDSMTVVASLVSAPAGNVALPVIALSETTSAHVATTLPASVANRILLNSAGAAIAANTKAFVVPAGATVPVNVTAKFKVYMNAPAKVGTYVVKLTPAVSGVGVLNASAQTLTITVSENPADDTVVASATSLLSAGETNSATADATVTHTRTASTTAAAGVIKVTLKNKNADTVSDSFTATIAGPGLLGAGAFGSAATMDDAVQAKGRAITVKNGDVVAVFPDGTSGEATITIGSSTGIILATEKITFFGAATTVVATVKKAVIGASAETADVLSVVVKDSAGVSVSNLANALSVVSSATSSITTDYSTTSTYSATTGAYLVAVTAGATAGSANLTVTTNASATDTTGVSAAAVSVRVGSSTPASVAVTLDKTSYAPGEKATITISLKDAAGLDLAAGNYASIFATGGIAANYTLGGGSDTTTATYVNGYTAGAATYTVYMPVTEGDVKFSWTTGSVAATSGAGLATANQAVAGSVTVSVSSPSTAAATDAANEATDAANAATDAALAAAEAADAATSAAQEASDAVAALSESVTKLIAGLQSQIKSLAAVVAKIAKKVKA
jgi:trimeric autotransporter adhesin